MITLLTAVDSLHQYTNLVAYTSKTHCLITSTSNKYTLGACLEKPRHLFDQKQN